MFLSVCKGWWFKTLGIVLILLSAVGLSFLLGCFIGRYKRKANLLMYHSPTGPTEKLVPIVRAVWRFLA